MKILLINKFYHDRGKAGGVGRHILELQNLLESKGHEIIPFAVNQKETASNDYLDFFPQEFDLGEVKFGLKSLRNFFKIFYNREAVRKLERLIEKTKPDIAHVHNIYHHLSPAILPVLKKHRIPIVMTVHDYKLICPNYLMFDKGKICEKCANGKYYKCFTNKCVKNSYAASLVLALEAYFAKLKKYYGNVDLFIAPSRFMRDQLIKNGFEEKKVKVIPNFFELENFNAERKNAETEKYFIYFGRLSREKGVDSLIKSLRHVDLGEYKLKVAGSGDERERLEALADDLGLGGKIEFVGYKNGGDLHHLISGAEFAVTPSIWNENAPYSILEAYAFGKPVIGARIGGIPELIEDGKTGFLFRAGDEKDLAIKIKNFIDGNSVFHAMGEKGRRYLKEKLSSERFYAELIKIYSGMARK